MALLDGALRVLRVASDYGADWWYWQWFVTGVRDSQNRPDGYDEWFAEDGLAANLILGKGYLAGGDIDQAAGLFFRPVTRDFIERVVSKRDERNEIYDSLAKHLETVCEQMGGMVGKEVGLHETLPADSGGKLLSDVYHAMYVYYSTLGREKEALRARVRSELVWSRLGK